MAGEWLKKLAGGLEKTKSSITNRIGELVKYYKENGKPIVKPILGCEFYVCSDITKKDGREKLHHLVLLVKNEKGYENISKLNAIAFRDGFYFKPRIDYDVLEKHTEGLVCLSACIAGTIPSYGAFGRI